MSYQPCTIVGDGGFSKVNNPPTASGVVACISGSVWVRLNHLATAGISSGQNNTITDPDTEGFTDGWAFLPAGSSLNFGTERVHETAATEPVGQIDLYLVNASVTVNQH